MERPKLLIGCEKLPLVALLCNHLKTQDVAWEKVSLDTLLFKLPSASPDALLLIVRDNQRLGRPLIEGIKQYDDNLPVIVVSQSKEVSEVVSLMKQGIYDYFAAPFNQGRLQMSIQNAFRMYHLTKRVFLLENQLGIQTKLDAMVGNSPMMQTIFQTIRNVASTNATVLVTGESGTGKELVAKAIHRLSPRNNRGFIDINCGAIPRELLENELFGHERGAYTGADKRYLGCCERANGGTLFLDEISEMDVALQVKLLRFLQERQFSRVGGVQPIPVDVRIIAATNRNLEECIAKKSFREDLYYRLNVVLISVPTLQERKEDIPLLAKHFLERYSHKVEKIFLDFTPESMEALVRYNWPGNIRELENTIERAVVLYNDTKIKLKYLPPNIQTQARNGTASPGIEKTGRDKVLSLDLVERYAIEAALKSCTGNIRLAARRLKIGQATLYRKIRQYGIRT